MKNLVILSLSLFFIFLLNSCTQEEINLSDTETEIDINTNGLAQEAPLIDEDEFEQQFLAMQERIAKFKYVVAQLDPYVQLESGEIELNAPQKVIEKLDPEYYQIVLEGMNETNKLIRNNTLSISTIQVGEVAYEDIEGQIDEARCQGWGNYRIVYWWGYELWATSCTVNDLVNHYAWVGSAAAIAAAYPAFAPAAGLLSATLVFSSVSLNWYHQYVCGSRGLVFVGSWVVELGWWCQG